MPFAATGLAVLDIPLHVASHKQIKLAVIVVIEESG